MNPILMSLWVKSTKEFVVLIKQGKKWNRRYVDSGYIDHLWPKIVLNMWSLVRNARNMVTYSMCLHRSYTQELGFGLDRTNKSPFAEKV